MSAVSFLDRFRTETGRMSALERRVERQRTALHQARESNALLAQELRESIGELEMAIDSAGWERISAVGRNEFTRDGLRRIIDLSRIMTLKNPLIRRSVLVQSYYVFGQGVHIQAADERVNEVVQRYLDDQGNKDAITSHVARTQAERTLQHDGNLPLVNFADPKTGRLSTRLVNVDELTESIITNPDDGWERWYYERRWTQDTIDLERGLVTPGDERRAWYPDWRVWFGGPAQRGIRKAHPSTIGGAPVEDAGLMHIRVGGTAWMRFGVPDVYAALDWALAYKSFLENWHSMVASLSRFAWRVSTTGRKVKDAKRKLETTITEGVGETNPPPVPGSFFLEDEDTKLAPIPKTGATVSADDGRQLRLMIAAATDTPDTILANDPQQGALATAKTLDRPTELRMRDRQLLWEDVFRDLCQLAIAADVRATSGILPRVADSSVAGGVRLADEKAENPNIDTSIEVKFPPILEEDRAAVIDAIVTAATLDGKSPAGTLPDDFLTKLLLITLEAENVDELVNEMAQARKDELGEPTSDDERMAVAAAMRDLRNAVRSMSGPRRLVLREGPTDEVVDAGGVMVGWFLPPETAEALAIPGGEDPAQLHLTLGFLGTLAEIGASNVERLTAVVKTFAAQEFPLRGRVAGLGRFSGTDPEPVIALVDMPGLDAMRTRLVQRLVKEGLGPRSDHSFTPHITLAWVRPGDQPPVEFVPDLGLYLDRLCVTVGAERFFYLMRSANANGSAPYVEPTSEVVG